VRVLGIRYNGGATTWIRSATKAYNWSIDRKTGALKSLRQRMDVGHGRYREYVSADYDARKNQTVITVHDHDGAGRADGDDDDHDDDDDDGRPRKIVMPGLVLLKMATDRGSLEIEY
jgi:hypothetical protein